MTYINYSWWLIRITGLLLLPFMFYDIEIFFLLFSLIYFHAKFGFQSMFLDYVHDQILFEVFSLFLKLLSLGFVVTFFDVFL